MDILKWSEARSRSQHNMQIYRDSKVMNSLDCSPPEGKDSESETNQKVAGNDCNDIFPSDSIKYKELDPGNDLENIFSYFKEVI